MHGLDTIRSIEAAIKRGVSPRDCHEPVAAPAPKVLYRVVRKCCTSGCCIDCRGRGRLTVTQIDGIKSERHARRIAAGWESYGATVEPSEL